MTTPHDLLKDLLEYIEEQAKEIDPRAYRISATKEDTWRNTDLQGLPGLALDLRVEGDPIWLHLARLKAHNAPTIPDPFKGLFKINNDPFSAPPVLNEYHLTTWIARHESDFDSQTTLIPDPETEQKKLRQKAETAAQEYLSQWIAWAESERPRRRSIAFYDDLFTLKHQIESEETVDPQEVVWGVGVTSWHIPFKEGYIDFEYPILTQAVEISIDEKSMALEVRPRDTDIQVEMQPFVACSVPGATDIEKILKTQLQERKNCPVTPFDPASYTDLLQLAASNLDSHGNYQTLLAKDEPIPTPGANLVVTDAWVLLSRRRQTHYLTDDLKRLKDKLVSGCHIPVGPLALVTPPSDQQIEYETVHFRGLSSRGSIHRKAKELYFPLPYNKEQMTIIQRLENAAGVTVQGPPGTGKTHTIANVICHYLATGRRVLVTSRGEPALKVLQSKIPEAVRPLTVALMASDRAGIRQFQASIETIQHQISQLNPEQTSQAIARLEKAIDRTHQELTAIDKRIDTIALTQLSDIKIEGVSMRPQKLAELVVSGSKQHGWFDDTVTLSSKNAPPLSELEADELRHARKKVGRDLIYVHATYPAIESLPDTAAIAELHGVLSSIRTIEAEIERGELPALKATTTEMMNTVRELVNRVETARKLVEELETIQPGWPLALREKFRQASYTAERRAFEHLFEDINGLIVARGEFLKRPVHFPDIHLLTAKTREAINRAAKTGKPFGLIAFRTSATKKQMATIKVAGLAPSSTADWSHVRRYIDLHEQLASFVSRWNQLADELLLPPMEANMASLRQIEIISTIAKKTHRLVTKLEAGLLKKADAVFATPPNQALMGSSAELNHIKTQLLRHLSKAKLSCAATQLDTLQETLMDKTGPISTKLRQFLEKPLGNPHIPADQIVADYTALMAELHHITSLAAEFNLIKNYASRIQQKGAPKLAARICSQPVEQPGEDIIFPVTWQKAWNWAQMRTHLDKIEAREELLTLSTTRHNFEESLARFYKEIVAKTAWLATKQNTTPRILQALAGYATAIHRIGQGTGPNAMRYRKDAREAMQDAADAIPCWIMSHARISEAMPPDIGAFDLVIVDEASQSNLWSLPAILRGKKILIVGDHKQVSPDAAFISSQKIQKLKARFLADQPYGTEMTLEKSLYDLAARVFASEHVMLREHFRCVSPIIAYSNQVFYKGGIQPLRIPKTTEKIDPPLVDIYIPDGLRDIHDRNDYEAQAIAEEMITLLKNDAFAGRTIGVVSLLGIKQAKHIDSIVRQRCDSAELLQRNFECGDARTFQGSERDIIFLSMVVDSKKPKALSGNQYDQRFNVAASRARDRMYLIRSVKITDLSDTDLRLTLLNHFTPPLMAAQEETEVLIDRCKSGFEREVFSILTAHGYRVIPQIKAGAYRIDMVVEGRKGHRLAIELDGDAYHGPDRWQHDMYRQRVLERAGWVFWRCFASTWTRHREDVLQALLARLRSMHIEPIGGIDYAPNLIEKRIWKPSSIKHNTPAIGEVLALSELY